MVVKTMEVEEAWSFDVQLALLLQSWVSPLWGVMLLELAWRLGTGGGGRMVALSIFRWRMR